MIRTGEDIKKARLEKGITQAELAKLAEVSACTVSDIERTRNLTAQSSMVICDALGVEIEPSLRKLIEEKYFSAKVIPNGEIFKEARFKKGLSQPELAKITGSKLYEISYIERSAEVKKSTAEKVANELGISLDDATEDVSERTKKISRTHEPSSAKVPKLKIITASDFRNAFDVGETVIAIKYDGKKRRRKMTGEIIAKHKRFALVDLGKYKEGFNYVDLRKAEGKGRKAI